MAKLELGEAVACLRQGLAALPTQQAEVFWMREIELMSTAEVADELQVPPDQVATWLYRAKQKLRDVLSGHDPNNSDRHSEVRQ